MQFGYYLLVYIECDKYTHKQINKQIHLEQSEKLNKMKQTKKMDAVHSHCKEKEQKKTTTTKYVQF